MIPQTTKREPLTRKQIAELLKFYARSYYTEKCYAVNAEVGLNQSGQLRADLLGVNMKSEIVVCEIKSCPADFYADHRKGKWHKYLEYSNKLYFVVGVKTYEKIKNDIPKGVGIFVLRRFYKPGDSVPYHRLRMVQRAEHREMNPDIKLNLCIRLAFRNCDFNRYGRRSKQ
jgi:hypothetical protein